MNKILNVIKKNYIYVNYIFIFLAVYIILFPLISKLLENINPNITRCYYLTMTGKPCPLCGGTRYIANLPSQIMINPKYLLQPFGAMILFVIFELLFRIYLLIKKRNDIKIIKIDIIIHIVTAILFFAYEIIFFIVN